MRALLLLAVLVLAGCASPAANLAPAGVNDVAADAVAGVTLLLTGHDGVEPTIGATKAGSIFVTGGSEVLRSRDRGATWEVVYSGPLPVSASFDPMLWVDPVTDVVYDDPMWPPLACSSLVSSKDDGETWFQRDGVCHPPPMDHQRLGSGLPGPKAPPLAGVLHPTVLYQCYNQVLATTCASSFDGGLSWAVHTIVALDERDACAGLNGSPRADARGVVVVPIFDGGCPDLVLGVSEDNGATWTLRKGPPGVGAGLDDPSIAFTPDGTMYVAWTGNDFLPRLARSRDLGASWDGAWVVSPPDVTSTTFPAMVAGADGRVALAFVGTRGHEGEPSIAPEDARWHVFVVTTSNAGAASPAFATRQATPDADPVQIGCVWQRGLTVPQSECRNMADFNSAAMAPDGTFYYAYTDGCVDGCASASESRASVLGVARLDDWSLLA